VDIPLRHDAAWFEDKGNGTILRRKYFSNMSFPKAHVRPLLIVLFSVGRFLLLSSYLVRSGAQHRARERPQEQGAEPGQRAGGSIWSWCSTVGEDGWSNKADQRPHITSSTS
jgi:hypothetical protein